MDFILLLAQGGGGGGGGGPSPINPMTLLIYAVCGIAIFYLMVIKPQKKREKERQDTLSKTKVGDRVVSIGGIRGTITAVKEKTFMVKVADKTVIEFNRPAISRNLDAEERSGKGGDDKDDDASEANEKEKS